MDDDSNALVPRDVTESGKITVLRFRVDANAFSSIVMTRFRSTAEIQDSANA